MKNKLFNLILLISIFVLKASAQSDIVQITPDQYIKCLSNPTFQFTNSTIKQCDTVGVNAVRFEYWNFGDHWNLGHDSIIDWTAWFTPNSYSITYPTAGNYNILLIDSSSCGRDSVTLTVTLINNPVAQVTSSNPVACKNGSVTINNSSSTGYSYQINSGIDAAYLPAIIGNNSIQFDSSGTFTVSLVAFFIGADTSCFDTSKVNVTILELPQPSFSISLSNQCDSAVANFSDASLNAVSWDWNFGNGNVATTQIVQSQTYTSGIYNVSLTVIDANNCQNEFVDTIKIYTSPTANFNGVNVCYNQTSIFTDQSIDFNNDTIQQWIWNFGDGNGTSNQNATHVFAAAGSYDVQLIINTIYCTDTINQTIEVYPLPTSFFNTNVNTGCSPLQVDFTNSSSGASTYNWNFGDGNSTLVSNPTHIFVASLTDTIYNVELIAITSFGCRDTILNSISVSGKPIANFSVFNDTVCSGNSVVFTNLSQGNSSNSWNLGNGNVSTLPNPITIYTNSSFTQSQINPIQLIIENINTCKDTFELNLVVLPEISASFNVDTLFCSNETALFTNTSVGATNYVWNFGDGTTSTVSNPQHNFQNIGTGQLPYTVNLVASSSFGCKDSISKVCYVLAGPEASFVASPQIQTYPSATINIFNSTVNASLYTINWNFGDGQTISTAFPNQHTYNTWGNYIITLSVQNGECTDVLKDTIEILPPLPIAGFNGKKQGCKPLSVSFVNNSQ